jgi:AcrR family transcriptional regulator
MRYKPGHKEESRARILEAVGRGFRRHGLGGIGVDGLAKEAGVTSGAFYGHFGTKVQAFEEAAVAGLEALLASVTQLQDERGTDWLAAYVDLYLGLRRTCDLEEACGLQALTPEVMRADLPVRSRYEAVLRRIVDQVAQGLPQTPGAPPAQARAWALLALLSGGVTLARSLADSELGSQAAESLKQAALAVARG